MESRKVVFLICVIFYSTLNLLLLRKKSLIGEQRSVTLAFTSNLSTLSPHDQDHIMRYQLHDVDLPNATRCVQTDVLFIGNPIGDASPMQTHEERPLPFLGTNVDYDVMGWTERLFDGLDFPVTHKLLVVGGCEIDVLKQVSSLQVKYPDLHVYRAARKMGCAPGWNHILRYMNLQDDIPFGFIFNNDIYTPPGTLRNLSREMWNLYDQDPLLCIAHSREWTAFSMTKRALQVLGLFDENLYPAYWEDDDMHIRLNHAVKANICSPVRYLTSATLQHNNNDDYVSGSFLQAQKMMDTDAREEIKNEWKAWSDRMGKGFIENENYFKAKWGCPAGSTLKGKILYDLCTFETPFQQTHVLSWWEVDYKRRGCIENEPIWQRCPYIIAT